MTLTQIFAFAVAGLLYGLLAPARMRSWFLMLTSVFAVYWLQPFVPIRYVDYMLPTATILLTIGIWFVVRKDTWRLEDGMTLLLAVLMVIGVAATRYLIPELRPTPSRPPGIVLVLLSVVVLLVLFGVLARFAQDWRRRFAVGMVLLIAVFVVMKTVPLTQLLSEYLRTVTGEAVDLADAEDVRWLGFSYVAFRLLHMLRDAQQKKLPAVTLREHLTFVLFFPAFTAGPIDRAERFTDDLRALPQINGSDAARIVEAFTRIAVGIFKKFAVADTLALVALNETNATQIESTVGMWVVLYIYAFRLFFDFSGYTDIAIGLGLLFGVRLPENFNRPYLRTNITAFWQSWHMTLSNWVRFYVFFPVSRAMLRWKPRPDQRVIVLTAHLSTMVIIGLWHQISLNFLVWGLWHGLGLFVHKIWSDNTRKWFRELQTRPLQHKLWSVGGVILTFHFVALGWVWFSLTDVELAVDVFARLLGIY